MGCSPVPDDKTNTHACASDPSLLTQPLERYTHNSDTLLVDVKVAQNLRVVLLHCQPDYFMLADVEAPSQIAGGTDSALEESLYSPALFTIVCKAEIRGRIIDNGDCNYRVFNVKVATPAPRAPFGTFQERSSRRNRKVVAVPARKANNTMT